MEFKKDNVLNPEISVIIPTYNRAYLITKTIDSVLKQTYDNFELIIVDDGSTDNTKEVINPYLSNPKVKYIYQENKERGAARNNGIRHARGIYVALLDSDDLWLPEHLEICKKTAERVHKTSLIFSNTYIIDDNDKIVKSARLKIKEGYVFDYIVKHLYADCNSSSVFIPKIIFDKVGYFIEQKEFTAGEDTELWIRIAYNYPFYSTHKFTVLVRRQKMSSTFSYTYKTEEGEKNLEKLIDMLLANHSLPIKQIENLLKGEKYTALGEFCCHLGNMKRTRYYLYKAVTEDKKQLFMIRWWVFLFMSILGRKIFNKLKKFVSNLSLIIIKN
jgi:glycosyltransferase involved in cell wall biosynthesis